MNFDDYIREYELSRIEGVLLRYLTEVYKILVQSVPDLLKNDEIDQMTAYFESLVQETDASLLDEWMEMKDPTRRLHRLSREAQRDQAEKIRIEKQNFYKNLSAWSRNNSLRFMRSIDQSLRLLPSTRMTGFEAESVPAFVMEMLEGSDWTWEKVINTAQEFLNSSEEDSTDPATVSGSGQQIFAEQRQRLPKGLTWTTEARGSRYSVINRDEEASAGCWYLQQILFDAQGPTDWCLHFKIDIAKSLEKKAATMTLINFASINFHQ